MRCWVLLIAMITISQSTFADQFTYSDGTRYEGQMQNGAPNGKGNIYWKNGTKYMGMVSNGLQHGQGTTYFANGKKYVGEYASGKMNGQGTFYFPDGGYQVGEFRNSEGYNAKEYDASGVLVKLWSNGVVTEDPITKEYASKVFQSDNTNRLNNYSGSGSSSDCPTDVSYLRGQLGIPELANSSSLNESIDSLIARAGSVDVALAAVDGDIKHMQQDMQQYAQAAQQSYGRSGSGLDFRCARQEGIFCSNNYNYHTMKESIFIVSEMKNAVMCRKTGRMEHASYQAAPVSQDGSGNSSTRTPYSNGGSYGNGVSLGNGSSTPSRNLGSSSNRTGKCINNPNDINCGHR